MSAFVTTASRIFNMSRSHKAPPKVNEPSATESAKTTQCSAATVRRMPVLYTPDFKKHRPPPGMDHPECPQRLDACVDALKNSSEISDALDWITPKSLKGEESSARRELVLEAIREVHTLPEYIQRVKQISTKGGGGLDHDTYVAPESYEIALLAASTWMEAVDMVMDGQKVAWALARPPGHHATPATGMGFCLFSNAAIAAKYALKHKDVNRVAILDYDVHAGNGTEAAVKNEENIRFASSHQWPLYPGTGMEGKSGRFDNILNINLDLGDGLDKYKSRFEDEMLPFLLESEHGMPDLVIVSAGFDALDVDPLAQLEFKPSDYRLFTQLLLKRIGKDTKVIFGLEGGYDLGDHGLGAAVRESIAGYCVRDPDEIPELADET